MTLVNETAPVRLRDYRPPAWQVRAVELLIDFGIDSTEVSSWLTLHKADQLSAPLRLNGEGLELLSIALDDHALGAQDYRYEQGVLQVDGAREGSVLETRVRVRPAANTALEGLYLSGSREDGFLLTQCEAEGFRHITFFPDRPDVLARYTVTLRADRARFPVLLAGGNPAGHGDLPDGRHWARFVDPYPKPCYLFALVAGRLKNIQRDYVTAEGRKVKLMMWSEAHVLDGCHYALNALERAMRWDERGYGRNYDLDVFHVVATHDFNMGAMENKGLNIFNAKYLIADADTSTDDEYRAVEAVVAHEYFHNWTGNRVTCRDWFQLSLKEGLTVFREQQFSAEMNSASLKRIEDVALLRRTQFPEDRGPLAHPVRPAEYRAINNFYTATVYEKGAELVRMVAGRLGQAGFRRGMDLYFKRHDGQAATIENFLAALGDANRIDLMPYLAWYSQAGTPRLEAKGEYDAARSEYTLTLSQHTHPTPGQSEKRPLPIPVRLSLFDRQGRMLPLCLDGQRQADSTEKVIVLDQLSQRFVFKQVPSSPVPSLLRGFSAPVALACDYTPDELALLLMHDMDGFNRWEAGQQLAMLAFDTLHSGNDSRACKTWCAALAALFNHDAMDEALLADLLTPPDEIEFAVRLNEVDPTKIHTLRQRMQHRLAEAIGADALFARYRTLAACAGEPQQDGASQAKRRLKRRVLELLALIDAPPALELAVEQYDAASGMTDRLAALGVLVRQHAPQAPSALAHFRERYANHPLALDKWFTVQAQVPDESALAIVKRLESDPSFTLKNPNRVRSLLGAFASTNPSGFHRVDGTAYAFLAERLVQLDALNPQIAARLATAFNGWQRLELKRKHAAQETLIALAQHKGLSPNLSEILGNVLQA